MIHQRAARGFLLLAPLAYVASQEGRGGEPPLLSSGETYTGRLVLAPSSSGVALHRIEMPEDGLALHVELACGEADLDLWLVHESAAGPGADGDGDGAENVHVADSLYGREELFVHRFSDPPLSPGTYRAEVVYPWPQAPLWGHRRLSAVDYRLTARVVRARVDAELRPGEPHSAELDDATGRFRSFSIEVPETAPALRIDVTRADGDVDLYLRRGQPLLRAQDAQHFAVHGYGRETLLVTPKSRPPLGPGTWFLDVVDPADEGNGPTPFSLLLGFDETPTAELLEIPAPPSLESADPLQRALYSVVELFVPYGGGSGCLIGEEGRILTCAHVVSDLALDPLEEVVVGVTVDPRKPSAERFRARVVVFDRERDLAVLEIASGLYGQPVPAGHRFPALPLGDPEGLAIGDPLWVVGYPGTGGSRSRVSITATRGILAGFESSATATLLKTDAKMHEGHSGGAVLDASGRLVALPSFTTYGGSSELGYLIPLSSLPKDG